MSGHLELEQGEQVVVSTRAHVTRLLPPLAVLVVLTFLHSFLQRVLEVRWRPVTSTGQVLHTAADWAVGLIAVLAVLLLVLRPIVRWARTRLVLTDRRLMLLSSAAPGGAVRLPLGMLRSARSEPARLLAGGQQVGTLSADFGQGGTVRMDRAPQAEAFAELIEAKAAPHRRMAAQVGGWSAGGYPSPSGTGW